MADVRRRRFALFFGLPLLLIGGTLLVLLIVYGSSSDSAQNPPQDLNDPTDVVVAEADGIAIHRKELGRAIPSDLFGVTRRKAEKQRLTQLLRNALLRKFLNANGIVVPEELVTKEIQQLYRNYTATSCPYCAPAATFQDMLATNFYTVEDVKNEIRNKRGIEQYIGKRWDAEGRNAAQLKNPKQEEERKLDWQAEQRSNIESGVTRQVDAAIAKWETASRRAEK